MRFGPRHAKSAWGLAWLLTATLSAQEPARKTAFGLVRNADGKPWAGATVELLHRAHPGVLRDDYSDTVSAKTDERGRFRVQLLVGMPYAVWARSTLKLPPGRSIKGKLLLDEQTALANAPVVLQVPAK